MKSSIPQTTSNLSSNGHRCQNQACGIRQVGTSLKSALLFHFLSYPILLFEMSKKNNERRQVLKDLYHSTQFTAAGLFMLNVLNVIKCLFTQNQSSTFAAIETFNSSEMSPAVNTDLPHTLVPGINIFLWHLQAINKTI